MSARLRSDFRVSLPRLVSGAAEAGAIFVSVDHLDGRVDLYGPAPQLFVGEDVPNRLFHPVLTAAEPSFVEARMKREIGFDPDLWWIAIDDRAGRSLLDLAGSTER